MREFCHCNSIWCALDWITGCRIRWICDKHDAHILSQVNPFTAKEVRCDQCNALPGECIDDYGNLIRSCYNPTQPPRWIP